MTGYMGYLGSASVLTGMWFIGRKWRFGFLLGVVGEIFWFTRGWQANEIDLMALAIIFSGMNAWNWIKWGRKKERDILLFSQRCELAREVTALCEKHDAKQDALGHVTALQMLGVDLRRPESN